MNQSPEDLIKQLQKNQYAPVYFLQGDEAYYIDSIAQYVEQHAIPEAERSFNQIILYGRDAAINEILTQARRFPMMAERQLVLIKEAQDIPDINREGGSKLLVDYLENPSPSTILVFCYKYKSIDKRKALGKALEKAAVEMTSKKLYDNQIPAWIMEYARSKDIQISEKATQMLADNIGNNLKRLAHEIDKVLINIQGEDKIEAGHIQEYVGISKEYNAFELQKAIAVKDVVKANMIINYFAANLKGNPIIPTIALLFGFFSKLLMVHHTKDKSKGHLAGKLRVNPFFVAEYLQATHHYPLPKVIDNIHHLRLADIHSKGINANTDDGQILKELIFKLLH